MTKEPEFTCLKDSSTYALPRLHLPIFICTLCAMLLLPVILSASLAYAEEPKVFTDADLANYKSESMVDQETVSRMDADLKSYEKKRDTEYLLDKERSERLRTEEAKRAAVQKQNATVTRTAQGSGSVSKTSPVRLVRT